MEQQQKLEEAGWYLKIVIEDELKPIGKGWILNENLLNHQ